jgi:hypothetical protein
VFIVAEVSLSILRIVNDICLSLGSIGTDHGNPQSAIRNPQSVLGRSPRWGKCHHFS